MKLDLKQTAVLLASASVAQATVQGFDISHYQANVNFAAAYNSGARFVMIKVRLFVHAHYHSES
jgi:GH25 family lysozyme M1 (1,4-beta-N-acetylmuramidase)